MSVDEGLVFDAHIAEEVKSNLIVKHLSLARLFLQIRWKLGVYFSLGDTCLLVICSHVDIKIISNVSK